MHLSAISYQLSAISYQPSAVSYQLPATRIFTHTPIHTLLTFSRSHVLTNHNSPLALHSSLFTLHFSLPPVAERSRSIIFHLRNVP